MERVVVVDEAGWAIEQVRKSVTNRSLEVVRAESPDEATRAVQADTALLILNICLQPSVDFSPLESLVHQAEGVPLLVLAGCGPLEAAARVLFPGAAQVIRLPISGEELRRHVLANLERPGTRTRDLASLGGVVGRSRPMQEIYQRILPLSRSSATVLITGETGSGKGLLARTIHDLSDRRDAPFVLVSCAELTESLVESELFGHVRGSFTGATRDKPGLFEAADGGTILLDEVADASPTIQARLLRAVEDKEIRRVGDVKTRQFNARLIVTTNLDLEEQVQADRFRQDLFFRLRVLRLDLPPLRERKGDIPLLVKHYLSGRTSSGSGPARCSPLAMEVLESHHWPGNVRELFAVLEAAATTAQEGTIRALDLPRELTSIWAEGMGRDAEEGAIRRALRDADGHRGRAAETLGISRTTLWRRIRDLEIES